MKINYIGKNTTFTDAMKDVTAKKLSRIEKYFIIDEDTTARVVARTYDHDQKVEITIPVKHGVLRAEKKGKDYYAALDLAVDSLEKQIRRMKTQLVNRHKEALSRQFADEAEAEREETSITKVKSIDMDTMDMEEAVLQMELSGHDFYLYMDSETGTASLAYVRKDGTYGIIRSM